MIRNKQKGQGLVEFALILPILLLLLLGIIEGGRIIWAYITVQNAAREAARYAVTGKPYIIPEDMGQKTGINRTLDVCLVPEGETEATEPWLCEPEDRLEAIREVALRRGRNLAVSAECDTEALFSSPGCRELPGAFGVLVTGQLISPTVSLTDPVVTSDHPGTPGLNVRVQTFYNVAMLDPIFSAIMGERPIQVRGDVQMQNEGLEPALGGVPPASINVSTVISGTNPPGVGPSGERIWSVSGYSVFQNENLIVHLESHFQLAGPYDIYLGGDEGNYRICSNVNTNTQNQTDVTCLVDFFTVPPGLYDLYSTFAGQSSPLATAPQQVEVKASSIPEIVINGGNIWAANSDITLSLVAHQTPDEPFNIYFNYGLPSQQTIATNVPATASSILWRVPDVGDLCPQDGAPCFIQSRRTADESVVYAETELYINQPEIVLAGGNMTYAQGENMYIFLRGHTPGLQYDVKIEGITNTLYLGRSEATNAVGSTTNPLIWTVPGGDPPLGWPDGLYDISSHPVADPPDMTVANQIGLLEDVVIDTPLDPYITVDGGYVWPIDSFINIKVHKHQANTNHYLEFGDRPVPTTETDDIFPTGNDGTAVVGYRIPVDAVTDGIRHTYTIASFLYADGSRVAERDVDVLPVPTIRVLEGDRVLPDATITIEITNHSPDTPYQIIYANKVLDQVLTDPDGKYTLIYDLDDLPAEPPPDFSDPVNYGVFFDMQSKEVLGTQEIVATTQLAIQPADLEITAIDLPEVVEINANLPVTLTIRNNNPVTVSRYFDIDFYLDPSPLIPTYRPGQFSFPGDVKEWSDSLPPESEIQVAVRDNDRLFVGTYGQHTLYGYADTSDFVFAEPSETNNISDTNFIVTCGLSSIVETFDSATPPTVVSGSYSFDDVAELNDWAGREYGSSHGSASIVGNELVLNHTNGSTWGSSDAHFIYYYNTPVSSQNGLDISVKMTRAPDDREYSKAGIFIRSGLAANAYKVDFGLARDGGNSNLHHLQAAYREGGGTDRIDEHSTEGSEDVVNLDDNPVWLRLVREAGSNVFTYYYAQQATAPGDSDWIEYGDRSVAMGDQVYIGLFGSNYINNNNNISTYSNSVFDDFSYEYTTASAIPGWAWQEYGNTEANPAPDISGGHLVLSSDGNSTWGGSDNNLFFYRTDPVTTSTGIDAMVQIFDAPSNRQWSKAGLELNTDPSNESSPKINLGLAWNGSSQHRVQIGYRENAGSGLTSVTDSALVNLSNGPVWLRIEREAGSNIFNFYYLQQSAMPTAEDWPDTPYATANINIADQLYAGMFNASYDNNNYQQSEFDNFTITDPASCDPEAGQRQNEVPPGLRICTPALEETGFESPPLNKWRLAFEESVQSVSTPKRSGLYALMAPSFTDFYHNPYFYQEFSMPTWILSSTTEINLSIYKYVDQLTDGADPADPHDKFYAIVATAPDLAATMVATSTEPVATGADAANWNQQTVTLQAAPGINLEDYAGQDLYLFFYNFTNGSVTGACPPASDDCGETKFYFDDAYMEVCTTQPLPDTIETQITGEVVLHPFGGTDRKIAGVKVWAYAEGGELYETMTIQNGVFNFYNLPATAAGTKYYIYAEYNFGQPIETLAADATVLLRDRNDASNPFEITLDLYTVF